MTFDKRTKRYRRFRDTMFSALLMITGILAITALVAYIRLPVHVPVSPLAHASEPETLIRGSVGGVPAPSPPPTAKDNPRLLDQIIGEAVDEFFTDRSQRSELRMIMHCLAHRENGHAANDHCGDSGKACGPFQFHLETWLRMRKQMIKEGYATEIGDRYDLTESTRTTVWAIRNENGLEWGPINRDANGSNYASCQKPSWY